MLLFLATAIATFFLLGVICGAIGRLLTPNHSKRKTNR